MRVRKIILVFSILFVVLIAALALLYFLGIWIPNRPSLADYPIRGIDVSHHQGAIRWPSVAAGEIRFAYIKATEGSDFTDPAFEKNWAASAAAGMKRGAYHFYIINSPGKTQAAHFIATVPADPGALPPAIDLELTGANRSVESVENFRHELGEFISTISAHYGRPLVIYTSADFATQYLNGLSSGPLWLSDFFTKPHPAGGWTFWQFSERGRIPGIDGFVDLDVFNGRENNF